MTRTAAAALLAGLFAAAALAGGEFPVRLPSTLPGPVGVSVGNEASMAFVRGKRWLLRRMPEDAAPERFWAELAEWRPAPLDDAETDDALLRMDDETLLSGPEGYETLARLALTLAERGRAEVFVPGAASPVLWRNALLRLLVVRQKPDTAGGGYWPLDGFPEDAPETMENTRQALWSLRLLLPQPDGSD